MSIRFLRVSVTVAVLLVLTLVVSTTAASARETITPEHLTVAVSKLAITLKTVTVGKTPGYALYDPATTEVYVANGGAATVTAINSKTYATTTIKVGTDPTIITYAPSTQDLYVLNFETSVSVIGTSNTVVHTVTFAKGVVPVTQGYDPANGDVYVLCYTTTGAVVNDINQKTYALTTVPLPGSGIFMTYDNATSSMVVAESTSNELTAISSKDVATNIKLGAGNFPGWMVYNPNDKDLYITDFGETTKGITKTGNVSVLSSANKIIATIKIGSYPTIGWYDPDNHDIYEVDTGIIVGKTYPVSSVSIISGTSVTKTLTVGKYAVVAQYDPKNNEMYIACPASNQTFAISNSNAIAATIPTQQYPSAAVYDPGLGDMLAFGFSTFNGHKAADTIVTVIPSTNTGTSTVTLGMGPPAGVGYDPTNSGFFVVNGGATSVTFIL
jgi:DNA-binding beta-propeller fold protein YncE